VGGRPSEESCRHQEKEEQVHRSPRAEFPLGGVSGKILQTDLGKKISREPTSWTRDWGPRSRKRLPVSTEKGGQTWGRPGGEKVHEIKDKQEGVVEETCIKSWGQGLGNRRRI